MTRSERINTILQNAAAATGNGATFECAGLSAAGFQVIIAVTATITFEATVDGTNWVSLYATNVATGASAATATASGIYVANIGGLLEVRSRISSWGSGAVTVTALATEGSSGSAQAASAAGSGGNTISAPLDRRADAQSVSVAWSTEDVALWNAGIKLPATANSTATIANAASLSGAVNLGSNKNVVRIQMPAAWTAASLTFQLSDDASNYFNLFDAYGVEYTVVAAASETLLIPVGDLRAVQYLKVRSGTSGTPVAQGGSRDIVVVAQ